MSELTVQDHQRITATLATQKAAAELAALEWQVRAENAEAALAAAQGTESTEGASE